MASPSPNGPDGRPRRRRWPNLWPSGDDWLGGFILGLTLGFVLGLGCAGLLAWATAGRARP